MLINFDDNLVKKVERVKYKNVKTFILNKDEINQDAESVHSDAASSASSVHSTGDATEVVGTGNTRFWVKKTSSPDVYELYDDKNKQYGIACVPTLKISKRMREIMADKNMVDKVQLEFEFSHQFKKWIPVV